MVSKGSKMSAPVAAAFVMQALEDASESTEVTRTKTGLGGSVWFVIRVTVGDYEDSWMRITVETNGVGEAK